MSLDLNEFEEILNELVPKDLALPDDFYGWIDENYPERISNVGVVVDFVPDKIPVKKFDVIVSHHFPYFPSDIPIFVVHTPLDRIDWGCNFQLGRRLKLKNLSFLDESHLGVIGTREVKAFELLNEVSQNLNVKHLRYYFPKESIKTIAVFSGCGLNFQPFLEKIVRKNVDIVISGDLTHHTAFQLKGSSIGFIDISHYRSEVPGVRELARRINQFVNAEFVDVGEPYSDVCFP